MTNAATSHATDYAQTFRCIGPDCEDSCCQGWQITLDQPALVQLQKLPDTALQAILNSQIIAHPTGSPETQVAHFQLSADRACPCLRSDHLCSIHAQYGEDFLPLGCRLFPRVRNRIDETLETSLSLSCPEAARLVLADPLLFQAFAQSPADLLDAIRTAPSSTHTPQPTPAMLFWPLRQLHLAILLDRSRPMAERLILLGELARSMDRDPNGIRALRGFRRQLQNSAAHPPATTAPTLLAFALTALDAALSANPENRRFHALVACFLSGMQYTPQSTEESLAARYQILRDDWLDPFLSRHPRLLENYLVNQVIRNLYPFASPSQSPAEASFFQQFSALLLEWTLIRIVCAGISGRHRDQLTQQHLIDAIQSLSRAIFHDQNHLPDMQSTFLEHIQSLPLTTLLAL
uniref:Lysine-N-methylase n=1 Tax=mine drainage metagenome TaxID=410659 RepID=E6QMB1_9ZZZZ